MKDSNAVKMEIKEGLRIQVLLCSFQIDKITEKPKTIEGAEKKDEDKALEGENGKFDILPEVEPAREVVMENANAWLNFTINKTEEKSAEKAEDNADSLWSLAKNEKKEKEQRQKELEEKVSRRSIIDR